MEYCNFGVKGCGTTVFPNTPKLQYSRNPYSSNLHVGIPQIDMDIQITNKNGGRNHD